MAAWREANPDKVREAARRWYLRNADLTRARTAAYQKANPEKAREWTQRYREANPEKNRARQAARRARKRRQWVEDVDVNVVWDRDGGTCHICGEPADAKDWHLDHKVPLALGGDHSYANTAVSHPTCNLRKGTRLLA